MVTYKWHSCQWGKNVTHHTCLMLFFFCCPILLKSHNGLRLTIKHYWPTIGPIVGIGRKHAPHLEEDLESLLLNDSAWNLEAWDFLLHVTWLSSFPMFLHVPFPFSLSHGTTWKFLNYETKTSTTKCRLPFHDNYPTNVKTLPHCHPTYVALGCHLHPIYISL
jgi:hypothetical protein